MENRKSKINRFLEISYHMFDYYVVLLKSRFSNKKEKTIYKLRFQKELIKDLENFKERKFNLKFFDKPINNDIVDQYLKINEKLIIPELLEDIMKYSLVKNYKEKEVVKNPFSVDLFSPGSLLDKSTYICFKNEDIAINILSNQEFLKIIKENSMQ